MRSAAVLEGRSASDGTRLQRNLPHRVSRIQRNLPHTFRQATADDARAIHALITDHVDEGHLLPRRFDEIAVHAARFIVVEEEGEIVGCADLAPLSRTVAEIRSLIVSTHVRSNGVGRQLIDALIERSQASGFEKLCAFTHAPSYFVRHGFSLVPHEWLPEKIRTDCGSCALFRTCGQYAVLLPLIPFSIHG